MPTAKAPASIGNKSARHCRDRLLLASPISRDTVGTPSHRLDRIVRGAVILAAWGDLSLRPELRATSIARSGLLARDSRPRREIATASSSLGSTGCIMSSGLPCWIVPTQFPD